MLRRKARNRYAAIAMRDRGSERKLAENKPEMKRSHPTHFALTIVALSGPLVAQPAVPLPGKPKHEHPMLRSGGLGLITGAPDDDCAAVGTYAQAGARLIRCLKPS